MRNVKLTIEILYFFRPIFSLFMEKLSFYQHNIDQRCENIETKLTAYKRRISKHWRWWIRMWHFYIIKWWPFPKLVMFWIVAHTRVCDCMCVQYRVYANSECVVGTFNRINISLVRLKSVWGRKQCWFMGYQF